MRKTSLCFSIFTAALLSAALADASVSYDLKARPLAKETRAQLEFLGYRIDDGRAVLIDPSGSAVSEERLAQYQQPFSGKDRSVRDDIRMSIISLGLRFDEAGDRVIHPYTQAPLSKLEVEYLLAYAAAEARPLVLERMLDLLSGQDPSKPLPRSVREQLSTLKNAEAGLIPETLMKLLASRDISGKEALRGVDQAYSEAMRVWDNTRSMEDLQAAAIPADMGRLSFATPVNVQGWDRRRTPSALINDAERRLSTLLQARIHDQLMSNPVGKEIWNHFLGKNGKTSLPQFVLVDLDDHVMACYNPAADAIMVNIRSMRKSAQDAAPSAKELLAHPDAILSFVKRYDAELSHELTHAWQAHRSPLIQEQSRGNTPMGNYLEHEHEAFLNHARYLHAQLLLDPVAAQDKARFDDYLQFLAGLDSYRDGITRRYLATWPIDAFSMQTALSIQKIRAEAAQRRISEDPRQGLRLKGLALGMSAMQKDLEEHEKRMAAFASEEYPRMKAEALSAMRKLVLMRGQKNQWGQALRAQRTVIALASQASEEEKKKAAAEQDLLIEKAQAWFLSSKPQAPFEDWMAAIGALETHYSAEGIPLPQPLMDARRSLQEQIARWYLEQARKETDPSLRGKALNSARFWASSAKDASLTQEIDQERAAQPPAAK
ncbi:MAG: hypothetical protein WCU88_12890 [Elusimicrobiota bacterium]|jgi:dsRNA-specific ribonuclease